MGSVLDREGFDQSVGEMMGAGIPFSLFMIRIFVMKRSNRSREKQYTSEALELAVDVLQANLRRTDLIGVYGNGELLVAMRSSRNGVGADRAAGMVKEKLAAMAAERDCRIRVLTGAARWFMGEDFENLYQRTIQNITS